MKRPYNLVLFLQGIAILLLFGFVIRVGADYYQYREGLKNLPFYYYVIGRSVLFVLPSLLCAIGASVIKRKSDS